MRMIKRYPNRKLYDSTDKGYVNLTALANRLREGESIQVTSHTSGVDLTNQTLAQILFEESKKSQVADTEVLARLIRESGQKQVAA